MSEALYSCFQAVQKDLIAFAIFAFGFVFTFAVQSLRAKVQGSSVAGGVKSKNGTAASTVKAPAVDDALAVLAGGGAGGSRKLVKAPTAPPALSALQALGAQGSSKDIELIGLYETEFLNAVSGDLSGEPEAERLVLEAILRQRDLDILKKFFLAAPASPRSLQLLRMICAEKRADDAMWLFEAIPDKTSYHYNTILDCCIACNDLAAAEKFMKDAMSVNRADVVTHNTLIKAFLQHNDVRRARKVMETMRACGMAPNCVTFNELLDATIKNGDNLGNTWRIVDEMQASGVHPNHVTASILLKLIQPRLRSADIERAMAVVDSISDEMDEVLLGSVIEACIRVNREDLLVRQLWRQRSEQPVQISSSHTYGSMIRAYGYVRDIKGVWATWREMEERQIQWTSITLGNMVEALVQNSDPEAAYDMIQKAQKDEQTRPLINVVIYGSILKGFSQQRRFEQVWRVYKEMLATENLQFTLVTFNTLVNACVRCGRMDLISSIMMQMEEQNIEPDIITYSAIIKGYCQEGQLDCAFELLDGMNQAAKFRPDEFTYNTLIDGCARRGWWERGISLVDQMQDAGVTPSNFTLSVLVKLASRCKRPEKAFQLSEEISQKYNFKLNVHVYNNLVQACLYNSTIQKSLDVFTKMAHEGVKPDVRTYKLLLSGCVRSADTHIAAGLLRAAFGLPNRSSSCLSGCSPELLRLSERLPSELVNETLHGIARHSPDDGLLVELLMALRRVPGLQLDPKLSIKVAAKAMRS